MLNNQLLNTNVQEFIIEKSNSNCDISSLVLSKNPFSEIPIQQIATQVNGRQKALKKFPLWATTPNCYYPPNLNLEQTSSEITAKYKSTLVSGNSLLDLTGGFGIDDYYFSLVMKGVTHCELNSELSVIAAHNFKQLKAQNIQCIIGDGLEILNKQKHELDWVYIDPSRRDSNKNKVFFLEDCLPDIPKSLDTLLSKSSNILLKTAPLLDIKAGLRSLKYVKEIHIIAIQNDVKELLWVIEKDCNVDPEVKTRNFTSQKEEHFQFTLSEEAKTQAPLHQPSKHLYEPNAAILKSGAFSCIANQFKLGKLHTNTHLYTSNILQKGFPGRTFEILEILPYNKKSLKKLIDTKANITTRNFPESVAVLSKKFKIKDGSDTYIFFTTIMDNSKVALICKKVPD